MMKLYID
jgi:hypothetical protein